MKLSKFLRESEQRDYFMNDDITTRKTKSNKTVAYFMGYTVIFIDNIFQKFMCSGFNAAHKPTSGAPFTDMV